MRTECSKVEKSTGNDKFAVTFTMYKGAPDDEYVSGECTSAAVFDTQDEAYAGAARALAALESNGCFPNMCVKF